MQLSSVAIFILITLVFAVFALAVYSLISWLKSMQRSLDETRTVINNSLSDNTRQLNESLGRTTQDIYNRLTVAATAINDLKKEAGAFAEVSRSMKDLHDFLKSPKLRGNIGESVLSDLLAQIFPKSSYQLQFSFRSGEKVDAIIKTDAGLLPIDSKFPMENYQKMSSETNKESVAIYRKAFNKDIKKHLLDISQKYILPAEKTLDFALMYIPSESVYYELAIDSSLMDYARSLRVYPVSPNTMYATLQTILLSFEGKKIEQKAKDVFVMLRSLQKEYDKTTTTLQTLGTHLKSAYNKYSEVQSNFGQIGQKLDQTKLIEP
jgi:DNA recombination protein RmuC